MCSSDLKFPDQIPLSEAIKTIDAEARRRDPEGKGVNFIIASSLDPYTPPIANPTINPTSVSTSPSRRTMPMIFPCVAPRAMRIPISDVREKLIAQGAEPMPGTPAQMGAFMLADIAKWGRVAKAAGTKAE